MARLVASLRDRIFGGRDIARLFADEAIQGEGPWLRSRSEAEWQEMMAAKQERKRRAKDEDPALTKAGPDSATSRVPGKDADRKCV
jgi:hypothetical protein